MCFEGPGMVSPMDEDLLTAGDLNLAFDEGRASLLAEMEALKKENERLHTALEIISDEAVSDPSGFAEAHLVPDAALAPSKEKKP
jgi:hypothetical protein